MIGELKVKSIETLYNNLKKSIHTYPNFNEWFDNIVRSEIDSKNGRREIISLSEIEGILYPQLTGIAILKNTTSEKNMCI